MIIKAIKLEIGEDSEVIATEWIISDVYMYRHTVSKGSFAPVEVYTRGRSLELDPHEWGFIDAYTDSAEYFDSIIETSGYPYPEKDTRK